jgi:hypothetical protein
MENSEIIASAKFLQRRALLNVQVTSLSFGHPRAMA